MLEAAVANLTEAQLAEYQRAATYVVVVTICEPVDAEKRLGRASDILKNAGITMITVPDIQSAIEGSVNPTPKDMACALMNASDPDQ